MKHFKALLLLLVGTYLLWSCKSEAQIFPGQEWASAENPTAMGWSQTARDQFTRYIIDSTHITGLVVVQKGQIVYSYGDLQENSYIASCRKSVLALLYGKYVENGTIDLDETLGELNINDVSPLLPIEKTAKIRDIISARSGVYLRGSNGGDFRRYAPERGAVKPGTHWLYSNWDFNVAGYIFEQQTKHNIYDELQAQLAIPLQMQDWNRSLQRKVGDSNISKFPAYHIWLSTRDMARVGLLMLRKGKWKEQQLVPEDWIDEITTERTSYKEAQQSVPLLKKDGLDLGYGYMWWLVENAPDERMKNAYSAQGAMGQNITVYPEIEAVLAFKTKSRYRRSNSIQTQMKLMQKAVAMYNPPVPN